VQAIASDEMFDWLYATLASWGVHRMGKGNTKLRDLPIIIETVRRQSGAIKALRHLSIGTSGGSRKLEDHPSFSATIVAAH